MTGVMTWLGRTLIYHPIPADRGWEAHYLGESARQIITDELRAAIEADVRKQRAKDEGAE